MKSSNTIEIKRVLDGEIGKITVQIYSDFSGRNYFIGYYIPSTASTFDYVDWLSDHYKVAMEEVGKQINITVTETGGAGTAIGDLRFSGRVYVYHEDRLTPQQIGRLTEIYETKQQAVVFRSRDYLVVNMGPKPTGWKSIKQ